MKESKTEYFVEPVIPYNNGYWRIKNKITYYVKTKPKTRYFVSYPDYNYYGYWILRGSKVTYKEKEHTSESFIFPNLLLTSQFKEISRQELALLMPELK